MNKVILISIILLASRTYGKIMFISDSVCHDVTYYVLIIMIVMTAQMVSEHPKSKLVALDVEVIFECKIFDGTEPHWVVNNGEILLPDQVSRASMKGFFITSNTRNMVTTLTLRMNATADKNGTESYCTSLRPPRSNTAVLLIIAGNTHYCMIH
jgi:hypothetical protein